MQGSWAMSYLRCPIRVSTPSGRRRPWRSRERSERFWASTTASRRESRTQRRRVGTWAEWGGQSGSGIDWHVRARLSSCASVSPTQSALALPRKTPHLSGHPNKNRARSFAGPAPPSSSPAIDSRRRPRSHRRLVLVFSCPPQASSRKNVGKVPVRKDDHRAEAVRDPGPDRQGSSFGYSVSSSKPCVPICRAQCACRITGLTAISALRSGPRSTCKS